MEVCPKATPSGSRGAALTRRCAGRTLLRTDFRVPEIRDNRPHRPPGPRSGQRRQAPADPHRRRRHPAHPLQDGRQLARLPRRGSAGAARPSGTRRAGKRRARLRRTSGSQWSNSFPPARKLHVVGHLGPDLLAADWGPAMAAQACQNLSAEPAREIGDALLDQRNLAGLGNMWRCEVLFLRGINPYRPVANPEIWRDSSTCRTSCCSPIAGGQVRPPPARCTAAGRTTSMRGPESPADAAVLRSAKRDQGEPGYARETYWCPRCQPA